MFDIQRFAVTLFLLSCGCAQDSPISETRAPKTEGFSPEWTRQLESGDWSTCFDVAADAHGNVYSTGFTLGAIDGNTADVKDAFLVKRDSAGKLLWGNLLGTPEIEEGNGVATDGEYANVTGSTSGKLGENSAGKFDLFLSKVDSVGQTNWVRQLGTDSEDVGENVTLDQDGNVLVTGWTQGNLAGTGAGENDILVAKFHSDGRQIWTAQFGTTGNDKGYAIATDPNGNILVAGSTAGKLGNKAFGNDDAFVAKLDPEGKQLWIRQLGTPGIDIFFGVAAGSDGDIFVSGHTQGVLGEKGFGGIDVFVVGFDRLGTKKWLQQLGTSEDDACFGMAIDKSRNLIIAGGTQGDLKRSSKGNRDAYAAMLTEAGKVVATYQLGTSEYDCALGVSADGRGNVFIGGESNGRFSNPETPLQDADAFTAKIKTLEE